MSDKTLVERLRDSNSAYRNINCVLADVVFGDEKTAHCSEENCNSCKKMTILRLADAIEREYLPRPRFEDGEPVQFGDKFESAGIVGTVDYILKGNVEGCVIGRKEDSGCVTYPNGKRVKRPEPEVLDADGVPIREGDTVWTVGRRIIKGPLKVTAVESGIVSYETEDGRHGTYFAIGDITHKEPDTLERIEADAKLDVCDYYEGRDEHKCDGCRGAYCFECKHEMTLDLLRRQREVLERVR